MKTCFSETTSKMAVSPRRRQAARRSCVRHKGGGRLHQVQTLKQTPTYLRQASCSPVGAWRDHPHTSVYGSQGNVSRLGATSVSPRGVLGGVSIKF